MTITLKTRKMLWARAANRCAFTDCREPLIHDVEGVGASVVGEEAHIVARELDGPRGRYPLPVEERDEYENLILLCSKHHKIIDDHPEAYSVESLTSMKAGHLAWVASISTSVDEALRRDEERYAGYVDEWARRVDLDDWESGMSSLLSHGHPSLRRERYEALSELRRWLLSRVWPRRYERLEAAFENFRRILNDLVGVFSEDLQDPRADGEVVWIRKTYQGLPWNPELYTQKLAEFMRHVDIIEDLALELTRAANLICDRAREQLDPSYRIEEGAVLISAGPMMNLEWQTYRTEYSADQRVGMPYPGLDDFDRATRFTRDVWFGDPPESGGRPNS